MNRLMWKKGMLIFSILAAVVFAALLVCGLAERSVPAFAETSVEQTAETSETQTDAQETAAEDDGTGWKAIAAGVAIGLAAAAGAVGMGIAVAKTSEATARQPEAEGKIRSSLMLGLVFIETAIIYALIVAILIIFVL